MTTNRTSAAVLQMMTDCQKGFVILNDLPDIAAKYQRMQEALETAAANCVPYMNDADELIHDRISDALAFDPLSDSPSNE
jgi:hypothetical protein